VPARLSLHELGLSLIQVIVGGSKQLGGHAPRVFQGERAEVMPPGSKQFGEFGHVIVFRPVSGQDDRGDHVAEIGAVAVAQGAQIEQDTRLDAGQHFVELVQQQHHPPRRLLHQAYQRVVEGQRRGEIVGRLDDDLILGLDDGPQRLVFRGQRFQHGPQRGLKKAARRKLQHPVAVNVDKQRRRAGQLAVMGQSDGRLQGAQQGGLAEVAHAHHCHAVAARQQAQHGAQIFVAIQLRNPTGIHSIFREAEGCSPGGTPY